MSTTTRTGKIGRLPRFVRDPLNERLDAGEPGSSILTWLNELEETIKGLNTLFDGKPVTHQNLSEWRQGGFQDWLRGRDARGLADSLLDRAGGLGANSGAPPLYDQLAPLFTVSLCEAMLAKPASPDDPAYRTWLLECLRVFSLSRRADHEAIRLQLSRDRREDELDEMSGAGREKWLSKYRSEETKTDLLAEQLECKFAAAEKRRGDLLAEGHPVPADPAGFLSKKEELLKDINKWRNRPSSKRADGLEQALSPPFHPNSN